MLSNPIKCRVFFVFFCVFLIFATLRAQEKFYKEATPLPSPRQMHGAVVLGDYLYVLGGNHPVSGYQKNVFKAPILSDGNLGQWSETTPLPYQKCYIENSTLVLNDIVYVLGGYDPLNKTCPNSILWTRPGPGGNLEPWRSSISHPGSGVHCTVAVATPGYLHLIGGIQANEMVSELVWSARISPDGTVTAWEKSYPLPTKLWYHCGAVAGGNVWIWGGLPTRKDNVVSDKIFYAAILSSGKLGPWKTYTTPLPVGFYASSSTVSGEYLISFCPRYAGREASNDIWFATVKQNKLSAWKRQQTDLPARMYIGLATDYRKGCVYIPGGRKTDKDKNLVNQNVFFFKLLHHAPRKAGTDAAQTVETGMMAHANKYSYMQPTTQSSEAIPGFISTEQSRQASGIPILLYIHTKKAINCKKQNGILRNFNTSQYAGKIIFAELDTLKYPQIAQQYGIFQVPCWVYFDRNGNLVDRKFGIIPLDELGNIVRQILM